MKRHVERALFVVAPPDSGKSTVLRSMFRDRRLGCEGIPPTGKDARRLPETYWLGNERRLYLRLTSPHEMGETPAEFLRKCRDRMKEGRWCAAIPLQPDRAKKMPSVVETIGQFLDAFNPERVRVAFLSPSRHGETVAEYATGDPIGELLKRERVEAMCLDGRERPAADRGIHGLHLSDFFDFA